jgi:hypothetical protein
VRFTFAVSLYVTSDPTCPPEFGIVGNDPWSPFLLNTSKSRLPAPPPKLQ